jgi:hypothetical protein
MGLPRSVVFCFVFLLFSVPKAGFCQDDAKDSVLAFQLESQGAFDDDFIRKTFYTWTTPEQIAELRKTKKLLVKSKSDDGGSSLYDLTLRDSAFAWMPPAKLLKQSQFSKKRYAWINGWATSMGMEGEKYGDQLIKIELKEDAIIGMMKHEYYVSAMEFYDMNGKLLDNNYVIENQDKIAAIYHVNRVKAVRTQRVSRYYGSGNHYYKDKARRTKEQTRFREFVIVNEQMIRWSYGTAEIKNELSSEIDLLKKLQASGKAIQVAYAGDCDPETKKNIDIADVNCAFESNKCFNIDYYMLNAKRLQAIIDQLNHALLSQSEPISN